MTKTSNEWLITTERFVAFIDIMGFKDMVLKMTHDNIYKIMLSIDNAMKNNSDIINNKDLQLVKSTTYSDSIMIYSKDDSIKAFSALVASVSGLTNDLFIAGIPHKGAIALGKMTLDTEKSIFFGQPLIDAYLLQEELHFYGIIIHGSVEETLIKNRINFVRKYDCPLKNGKSFHHTIYPMHIDAESAKKYSKYHQEIMKSLISMKFKTSGQLRRYIDNTQNYFDHIAKE